MATIEIKFPNVTDNVDIQRRWEEKIAQQVKDISGIEVDIIHPRPDYKHYINSTEWDILRNKVIYDYDGKCYMCGSKENIHVHHITYQRLGNEYHGDLIPLCASCHEKIHKLRDDLSPLIDKVAKQFASHNKIVNAMRQSLKDKMDVFVLYHAETIKDSIKKHIPNVIAGHKTKIASMIGNTLFYDILGRACPINKEFIKVLQGIKKK